MYILHVCVFLCCVEWRAGTILFDRCGGVGGGTVQIFLLLCLCSGGYSTVEMVRGGWSVFPLLSLVCCQLSWRLGLCGRNLCDNFLLVALWYFLAVFFVLQGADCQ